MSSWLSYTIILLENSNAIILATTAPNMYDISYDFNKVYDFYVQELISKTPIKFWKTP